MHEAIFLLQQETPLIHFLHNQPDATIRATELKPKLDIRIAKRYPNLHLEHPDWISKVSETGRRSLDYKISIRPTGKAHEVKLEVKDKYDRETGKNKLETAAFPHLLGNMGGKEYKEDLKNLVLYEGAEVTIKTWHEGLLAILQRELPVLLASENFGNRSGKGFGSFTCINHPVNYRQIWRYSFDWEVQGTTKFQQQKDLFSAINWFYKCLRSGINQVNRDGKSEFYFKSLLFAFAEKKGERWDKYAIKNHFFTGGNIPKNIADYRDWLGLSTEEMWGKKYFNQSISKSAEASGIDRFPSPLVFKPVRVKGQKFKVWFDVADYPHAEFENARIKVDVKKSPKPSLTLSPSKNFNFPEFFQFAFTEIDIEEHLERFDEDNLNPTRYWVYLDFIKPIFLSIQNNLNAAV